MGIRTLKAFRLLHSSETPAHVRHRCLGCGDGLCGWALHVRGMDALSESKIVARAGLLGRIALGYFGPVDTLCVLVSHILRSDKTIGSYLCGSQHTVRGRCALLFDLAKY